MSIKGVLRGQRAALEGAGIHAKRLTSESITRDAWNEPATLPLETGGTTIGEEGEITHHVRTLRQTIRKVRVSLYSVNSCYIWKFCFHGLALDYTTLFGGLIERYPVFIVGYAICFTR